MDSLNITSISISKKIITTIMTHLSYDFLLSLNDPINTESIIIKCIDPAINIL